MESKYKVGDHVVIMDNKKLFTSYYSWFEMHEDTKKIRNFKGYFTPNNGETGKIVAIHPHENTNWYKYPLCAILLDDYDSVVLIGEDGLVLNRAILFSDLIIQ
jgi:hypothetical protein